MHACFFVSGVFRLACSYMMGGLSACLTLATKILNVADITSLKTVQSRKECESWIEEVYVEQA